MLLFFFSENKGTSCDRFQFHPNNNKTNPQTLTHIYTIFKKWIERTTFCTDKNRLAHKNSIYTDKRKRNGSITLGNHSLVPSTLWHRNKLEFLKESYARFSRTGFTLFQRRIFILPHLNLFVV